MSEVSQTATSPATAEHPLIATLALAAAGCFWGSGLLLAKIAFEQMNVTENVTFRFLFGSIALLPVLITRRHRYTAHDLFILLTAALIGVPVQFLVLFRGLQLTTVSHASLMVGTLPMLLAVSSVVVLHEHLNWREWILLGVACCGAVLIALSHESVANAPRACTAGDALVVLSISAAIVMIVMTKKLVHRHDSLHLTAMMIIAGTMMLILWSLVTNNVRLQFAPKIWFASAAQGIFATGGAYLLWNWGLARVPASRAGVFLNMEPLLGTVLGVVVLHEHLAWTAVVGGAMIIASAIQFSTHSP